MTRLALFLFIIAALQSTSAAEKRWWGMSMQGEGPAQQFDFGNFEARGNSLTAQAAYQNLSENKVAVIRGVKKPDGTFWPEAEFQIGDSVDGPWRSFGHSSAHGKRHVLRLSPGKHTFNFYFDISRYNPMVGKHNSWARIVLPTGDSAVIALGALPP